MKSFKSLLKTSGEDHLDAIQDHMTHHIIERAKARHHWEQARKEGWDSTPLSTKEVPKKAMEHLQKVGLHSRESLRHEQEYLSLYNTHIKFKMNNSSDIYFNLKKNAMSRAHEELKGDIASKHIEDLK